ncbi:uncharacterized protein LOC135468194 [Liolophura sinensis]|uniref:uncharacterized protein LOC135468194 n=1 Tax=Liolophura sinensis TaxID=3198878 RepID=UPI0031589746
MDLSEYEQKKAIRDSILKVFQSHFKSQEDEKLDLVTVNHCVKPCRPGSTLSSMSDSDSPKQFSGKFKKKRRCSGRNKAKANMASKATKTEKLLQNMKAPHKVIIMKDADMGQKNQTLSVVTSNRLTARLGLFSKGRKSFTVNRVRGPIKTVTPEAVRKQAQEDIKKILNDSCADDETQDHEQFLLSDKENTSFVSSACGKTVTSDNGMHRCVVTPGSSLGISAHSIASVSCKSTPCVSIPVTEEFPESPPLDIIARTLLSDLKASRWFPGTSYLQELQDDLSKLMKQNCSNSENQTPPTVRPFRGTIKSVTVKRSLMQSLLSADPTAGDTSALKAPQCTEVNMETDHQPHLHIPTNCNPQCVQADMNLITESQDIHQYFDAKSLLSHNDSLIASRSHHNTGLERSGQNVDISGHGLPPLRVTSDMLNDLSQDMANRSSQSSGCHSHHLHPSLLHGASRPQFASATVSSMGHTAWENTGPQQAVITKLNEHPEYMPQFHGDYYKDWLDRWPDASLHHHHPLQHETMDILEMVDHSQSSATTLKTSSQPSRMMCDSPDLNSSPLYLPPTQILPLKPSLSTPSPPDRLYPRRLY